MRGLPRERRLTSRGEFDRVHRQGSRSSDDFFVVTARPNGLEHARLGMAVGVRAAGNAVCRNRLKRLIRESFRSHQSELPPLDVVVNARRPAGKASSVQIAASLSAHWRKVRERCARC